MIKKFDKDLVTTIENYSAYVYKITITFKDGTKKIYIGAHKGSIYDPYNFSSEDETFLKDLRNPDTEVYFEIIMKGTAYDMFDLENQMLEEVDAKNPKNEYYNNTNGGSRYTDQSASIEAFIDSILEKIKNGDFDKYIQYLSVVDIKNNIDEYDRVQIRSEDESVADIEYCRPIADEIDLKHFGDTSFLPPCLAFGEWGTKKDGILWIDGNQRYTSVSMSKLGDKVKTIVLPKKEYKKILDKIGKITDAMIDLAYLRNPLEAAPLPMKPKELSKRIFERSKSLEGIQSDAQFRFLAKQNRFGGTAKKIIDGAVTLWKNQEEAKKKGPDFHFYEPDSPEGKKILQDKRIEMETAYEDDIIWGPYSSATFGPSHMFGVIQRTMFDKKKYPTILIQDGGGEIIRPIIYHSSSEVQKDWEGGKAAATTQLLEDLAQKYNLVIAPYEMVSLIAKSVVSKATK